jgi:hypothetical protein
LTTAHAVDLVAGSFIFLCSARVIVPKSFLTIWVWEAEKEISERN